jgi:hypothetical protein
LGRTYDYDGSCCHTSVVGIALCLCQGLHLYVQFICVESIAGGDGNVIVSILLDQLDIMNEYDS